MLNGLKGSTGSVQPTQDSTDSVDTPTVLSLYSGGGGLDLGFRMAVPDARTVCYVERDAASIEVLVTNMQKGRLEVAPSWTDSGTFDGKPWRGTVDWIIGGFPCQPWSVAGAQQGIDDERWLWPHIRRIAREVEPRGLFLENVPGLFLGGIQPVLGELAEDGYDAIWTTVRAADVGAPHRRERCFILGYSNKPRTENRGSQPSRTVTQQRSGFVAGSASERLEGSEQVRLGEQQQSQSRDGSGVADASGTVGDADGCGRWEEGNAEQSSGRTDWAELPLWPPGPQDAEGWRQVLATDPTLEPSIRGDADGLAARVDRLRILGNGVVPQQAALAFDILRNRQE